MKQRNSHFFLALVGLEYLAISQPDGKVVKGFEDDRASRDNIFLTESRWGKNICIRGGGGGGIFVVTEC